MFFNPLSQNIPENRLNFPTTRGFRMKISRKLAYQYMAIFFNFLPTSNHLHQLQGENCDSNLRLVVDEDDHSKFRLKSVPCKSKGFFNLKSSYMSQLVLSASFEYLCYGATAIIHILLFQCEDRLYISASDVCRPQIIYYCCPCLLHDKLLNVINDLIILNH